jgi:hypothetical protein
MGEEIEKTLKRRARNPITNETELIDNMSYKDWYNSKVKAHGQADVDKAFKKAKNRSVDMKQFESYKTRLADNPHLPTNIDKFADMKYNNSATYQEITEHYRYKGRVPEATFNDFKLVKAIQETGVKGTVRVPPKPIDALTLTFNDDHASKHGCTLEDAIGYVQKAKCSIGRKRWDGYHTGYYSFDGATYVADETHKIKTAFSKEDFDPITKAVMEVFK